MLSTLTVSGPPLRPFTVDSLPQMIVYATATYLRNEVVVDPLKNKVCHLSHFLLELNFLFIEKNVLI
jgi:hypothetical protein